MSFLLKRKPVCNNSIINNINNSEHLLSTCSLSDTYKHFTSIIP